MTLDIINKRTVDSKKQPTKMGENAKRKTKVGHWQMELRCLERRKTHNIWNIVFTLVKITKFYTKFFSQKVTKSLISYLNAPPK